MPAVAAGSGCLDIAPRLPVREQRLEGEHVEAMAAAIGLVAAENRGAGKADIADRVERLVAHEFVAVTQAFRIDHAILPKDDRIVERSTEAEATRPKLLDVGEEP